MRDTLHDAITHVSTESKEFYARATTELPTAGLLQTLEDTGVDPTETLKTLAKEATERALKNIEDAIGVPAVVKSINTMEIKVVVTGFNTD